MPSLRPESFNEPDEVAIPPRPGVLRLMLKPQIVRTALNLINHGEQFWTHHAVNFWQIAMSFVVPYCVTSYGAARNAAQRGRGD